MAQKLDTLWFLLNAFLFKIAQKWKKKSEKFLVNFLKN